MYSELNRTKAMPVEHLQKVIMPLHNAQYQAQNRSLIWHFSGEVRLVFETKAETRRWFPFQELAINPDHICMKSYPLKQWQRFMITFEQWSTSWNIYIQSFSYRTAVFYNTFLIQCHLVKHKMSIWNSEILDVSGGEVLNTYLDPFNYSHCWYEAFSCPFSTLGFNSFQLSLFSAFYNCTGHQSHFFQLWNTKSVLVVPIYYA